MCPERADGYGMSVSALEKIIDKYAPDLIVTVDCGVSNREEAEYIKSRGVRVIVTDHHELPDVLPDCVVINPKISDEYPYDNLCGAGVAFKVACALLGEEAYGFADIAAGFHRGGQRAAHGRKQGYRLRGAETHQ